MATGKDFLAAQLRVTPPLAIELAVEAALAALDKVSRRANLETEGWGDLPQLVGFLSTLAEAVAVESTH